MEDSIREKLIEKCIELTEGEGVRTKNITAWLIKDVEMRLLPVMMGKSDIRRIPFCGKQTALHIERMICELKSYYKTLVTDDLSSDTNHDKRNGLAENTSKHSFTFIQTAKSDIIQTAFEKMAQAVNDTRARNLIRVHLKHYTHSQSYINDPSLIWNWYGAGRHSVDAIHRFLEEFKQQYLELVNTAPSELSDTLIALDYPFLNPEEVAFVRSFYAANGRYPVWFIAARFFMHSTDRAAEIFAQINGIGVQRIHSNFVAQQFDLTSERVRQLSKNTTAIRKLAPMVWAQERWMHTQAYSMDVVTEKLIDWGRICRQEQLSNIDFLAALAILSVARPITIIALHRDGTTTNSHANSAASRIKPHVVFAYDNKFSFFNFDACLRLVGHDAALKKIYDRSYLLADIAQDFFIQDVRQEQKQVIYDKLSIVLPLFPDVVMKGNELVLQVNRLNYFEEIYNILQRRRKPMTVDEIYNEFMALHPNDPHTESGFIRSYMLQDKRFQAVGRKSTYQLREWQQFAGSLSDLAVGLLQNETQPMPQTVLCRKMMEQRPATTFKSCHTSVYIAVKAGTLQFYIKDNNRRGPNFVGLRNHAYHPAFQPFETTPRKG